MYFLFRWQCVTKVPNRNSEIGERWLWCARARNALRQEYTLWTGQKWLHNNNILFFSRIHYCHVLTCCSFCSTPSMRKVIERFPTMLSGFTVTEIRVRPMAPLPRSTPAPMTWQLWGLRTTPPRIRTCPCGMITIPCSTRTWRGQRGCYTLDLSRSTSRLPNVWNQVSTDLFYTNINKQFYY